MTLSREQIEAIRKGCEGVTPGPWFRSGVRFRMNNRDWHNVLTYNSTKERDEHVCCVGYDSCTNEGLADAAHIARLGPDTVRPLCDLALAGLDAEAVTAALKENATKLDEIATRALGVLERQSAFADSIDAIKAEAYRRGASDMRERAAKWHDDECAKLAERMEKARTSPEWKEYADISENHEDYAAAIRSLPVEGEG